MGGEGGGTEHNRCTGGKSRGCGGVEDGRNEDGAGRLGGDDSGEGSGGGWKVQMAATATNIKASTNVKGKASRLPPGVKAIYTAAAVAVLLFSFDVNACANAMQTRQSALVNRCRSCQDSCLQPTCRGGLDCLR